MNACEITKELPKIAIALAILFFLGFLSGAWGLKCKKHAFAPSYHYCKFGLGFR